MSARQRSKKGCWTCRLRKKKCTEDGPPCTNCHQFGVLCHGYGPRPTWKDRGDLEKEEARKLRLHAKKHRTVSVSSIGSVGSTAVPSPSAEVSEASCMETQADMALSCSSPQPVADTDICYFADSQLEQMTSDFSFSVDQDFWVNEPSYMSAPFLPIPPQSLSHQSDPNYDGHLSLPPQSHFGIKASESDILLLMDFLETTFCRQYLLYSHPSMPQKSWLLCLMLRSPPFFNASLSMSGYILHLKEPVGSSARELAFSQYQRHRGLAISSFNTLYLNPPGVHGETVVCGVHLALLEVSSILSCAPSATYYRVDIFHVGSREQHAKLPVVSEWRVRVPCRGAVLSRTYVGLSTS